MYQRIKKIGQAVIMAAVLISLTILSEYFNYKVQKEENIDVLADTETVVEIVKQERDLVSSAEIGTATDELEENSETEVCIDTEMTETDTTEVDTEKTDVVETDEAEVNFPERDTTQETVVEVMSAYTDDTQLGWIVTPVCEEYQGYIEEICSIYGIRPELVVAIMESESGGVRTAYNGAYGCVGLMQINESVHQGRMKKLGVTDLYDPYSNILVGVDLLSELLENDDQNIYLALAHYHGERHANSRTRSGNYSSYVKKIMTRTEELLQEQGKE
ncbi:MAG: lytic transglycosylase domain-containing protein [Roseburia sp.]